MFLKIRLMSGLILEIFLSRNYKLIIGSDKEFLIE